MKNLDLGKMFGEGNQELQKANALKTYLVKLDEILPSEENPYKVEEESVRRLAENIQTYGLFQALTAQKEGTEIRLISGERRYTALKYLVNQGLTYSYNGEDITGYAPICYIKQTLGDTKTMFMISANAHRDLQSDEKNRIIDTTLVALEKQVMSGKFSWDGKRKATVLSSITGIKEHYVKDYLASKNREIKFTEEDPETIAKIRQSKQVSEEEKTYKNLLKQIKGCIKKFEEFDSYIANTLSDDELSELKHKCFELELHIKEYTIPDLTDFKS